MYDNIKIKTVFYPIRDEKNEDVIVSWWELNVAFVEKLRYIDYIESGDPVLVEDVFLICFDRKAEDKWFLKIAINNVKLGNYEINEWRGRNTANRKKTGKGGEYSDPANSIGKEQKQGG